jgi:uncharacterized repeat protein (TIGR03803 family)
MSHNQDMGTLDVARLVIVATIVLLATGARAQGNYKILHRFSGDDGIHPWGSLIFDAGGNLYGTTYQGGAFGGGAVYELSPLSGGGWKESVIYSFTGGADGFNPVAGLTFDQVGNLYGTTINGGTAGFGNVFKLAPNSNGTWTESVLYSFCSMTNCTDGYLPAAGLIFDKAGNLYSTTVGGGAIGSGTVFELMPRQDGSWAESVLYSFAGSSDGGEPMAALTFDPTGNLYGTAEYGGNSGCMGGLNCGVVFMLTPDGNGHWKQKVLHEFSGGSDGANPLAGLSFDAAGNLYGTTAYGGDFACEGGNNCGVAFMLKPVAGGSWKEKVLHEFTGGSDGAVPYAGLTPDGKGSFYGAADIGGNLKVCNRVGCGVVFKLTPDSNGRWKQTVLHRFADKPGALPIVNLILDPARNLYGTTSGHTGLGSVFEITP